MRTLLTIAATAGVAGALPATALAQDQGSRPTREFVQAAGQSDQFEILEGQAALAQSADPQVRAFAQTMIQHHSETSRSLRQATADAGLQPPPMSLSDDQARLLGALQSLSGRDFDKAYARHQALAHRSALVVQQSYAAAGDQPAVRRAAASAVPVISAHLATAEQLQAAFEGS